MSVGEDESLGALVSDVTRLFWRRLEVGFAAAGLDHTAGEARVLTILDETPGLRQTQLADRLLIEPMTVTGFLDRLEAKGLVTRSPCPADRRAKLVHPTPEGSAAAARMRATAEGVRADMLAGLSEDERTMLRGLLRTMRGNLAGCTAKGARA